MPISAAQLVAEVKTTGVPESEGQLKHMSETVDKTSGGFKGMLGNMLSIAGGIGIANLVGNAFGFLKDQLAGCLQESMDAQDELAQTNKVLQSTHDASGMTSQAILDLASKFSHLTKFTDDQTQVGENLLLTFTNIGKNIFPQATQTMLDLSQAMGQDTKTSAIQLGKALNDPLTGMSALQRVGVTFSDSQKEAVKHMMATNDLAGAQGIILKELQREFGGSAEAAGKTFGGQLAILHQNLDDVKQQIGDALLPILSKLVSWVNDAVMPALGKFGDWFGKNAAPALQQFGGMVSQQLKPVGDLINSLFSGKSGGLGDMFKGVDLKTVLEPLKQAGQIFANFSIGVNLFQALSAHSQELGKWFQTSVVPALKQAEPAFQQLGNVILHDVLPAVSQISQIFHDTFQKVFSALLPVFEKAVPIIIRFAGVIASGLAPALKFLMPYIVQAAQAIGQFAGEIATRVAPLIENWFDMMDKALTNFLVIWKAVWPYLGPILKGVWDELIGIVKIAWALLKGIIEIGLDLLSGNWGQAWEDFKTMLAGVWDGIKQTLQGAWEIVAGWVNAIIGLIVGLADKLVGHSIIPDMINSIVTWFAGLPGKALGAVQGLVGKLTGFFGGLANQALTWGSNIVQGIINGLLNKLSDVGNAAQQIAQKVADFLPHSPAKEGPLSKLNEFGPALVKGFSQGIVDSTPTLRAAITHMVQPAALGSSSSNYAFPSVLAASSGGGSSRQVIEIPLIIDGREFARATVDHVGEQQARQTRLRYGNRGF